MARRNENIAQINLDLYNGDHFKYWLGPKIDPNSPDAEALNSAIERVFQRNNLIRDCIDRHTDALIGKLPTWFFKHRQGDRLEVAEGETETPAAQADLLLQRWLDRALNLAASQDSGLDNAFTEAAKNTAVTGYGYLRLWYPKRFQTSPDPMQRVAIHCPANESVEYIYDADRFLDRINYRYTIEDVEYIESQWVDSVTNETVFEIQDDRGNILKDNATGEDAIVRLQLGGRYTIQRLAAPSLITESARDAQNAINFILTMLTRNLEQAGFLERIILGAQPPGHWDDSHGERTFIPDRNFRIGPGQTTFVQGVPSFDTEGNPTGYSNPSVQYRDPVSVETFERSHQLITANLYHQMGQGHLVAADLNMSGIARVQARQDFDRKLEKHRQTTQSAIGGIMGAALLMMVDQPEPYLGLEVAVQLRLSTSKPLPEELDQNRQDYQAELRSQPTAMSAAGIEDTDAEIALIDETKMKTNALNTASTLTTLGVQDGESAIAMLQSLKAVPQGTRSTVDPSQPLNPTNNGTTATSPANN